MSGTGTGWLKRVVIATAILTAIGLLADTGKAMAAGSGADGGSTAHALGLFLLVWLLSNIRVRRKAGHFRLGFEPSPLPRVRALSTVRRANRRGPHDNSGRLGG
ncbi:hypothetical protein RB623_01775 [Mesorhizobium sp. LHD-90]|uniref:hypothetical protein n=1 Tax=Mesorhizobium sp. LHD-90 TaxID=3071414 RepID=UPI0027E024FE|nr:hypothetical protein [Mesorhizobium sp. LHD-90]MDQ6432779.1 hypothetical protein [Mesorhizobium sp. LHD-90]